MGLPQGHEALVGFEPDLSIPFIGLLLWAGCGYISNSVADVTRTCVWKCWDGVFAPYWADFCGTISAPLLFGAF